MQNTNAQTAPTPDSQNKYKPNHLAEAAPWQEIAQIIWNRLEQSHIQVHGFLAEKDGAILKEAYQPPYGPDWLHRMFSITKSFCSLAIGFLIEDGCLSLDSQVTGYFPEYRPLEGFHPWLEAMTIRHMLAMETCHSSTTYKVDMDKDWVESFFTTPPSHRSGQIFLYDTSSSHTLAALVKKLTGKGVLDYLREKCLDSIGFSKDAYIIQNAFGQEMGGSGLMARPMDLVKLGRYLLDTLDTLDSPDSPDVLDSLGMSVTGISTFAGYLKEAVSFQTPTIHSGQTLDEQQGYGYQFWQIREGFAMYGMGGQYLLFYPGLNLLFVLTADTQNIKGGSQILLDIIHDCLEPCLPAPAAQTIWEHPSRWNAVYKKTAFETAADKNAAFGNAAFGNAAFGNAAFENAAFENSADKNAAYKFAGHTQGFTQIELSFDTLGGQLTLHGTETVFSIPFSFERLTISVLERYNQRIAVQAQWAGNRMLYLPIQITDECIGSIHILINLGEDRVTLWMKNVEETYFHEFQGFWEGTRQTELFF